MKLQTDGQINAGRDVILMGLLGAEEFGFATSVLIVMGCVMMRKCHLNTCPVGVATQNEELRQRFLGRADYLVNFFQYLAQEIREHLAEMGVRSLQEIIGRTELIEPKKWHNNEKVEKLDISKLLYKPAEAEYYAISKVKDQDHQIEEVKDRALIRLSMPAIESRMPVQLDYKICNTDRSVGAMLSGEVAKRYGNEGLAEDTLRVRFKGSAGQSFGAFLAHGVHFVLEGDANDYLGKGLSGGKISVVPPQGTTFAAENNIIAGNTLLYGATSGEVFINGGVGERFCVRNSGATAGVEGAGDHCCEYMTGGRTVVLGSVGRNFAAGMSGGVAYVLDLEGNFDYFCNMEMVELTLVEESQARRELKALISKHYEHTGSVKAKKVLDNWEEYIDRFIQVTPIEYKKVLHEEKMKELEKKIGEVQRDY